MISSWKRKSISWQAKTQTHATPPSSVRFETISAADLLAKVLPPQQWIVPDILPVGATLLAGRGKDGKSLMMWNLCLAVATGGRRSVTTMSQRAMCSTWTWRMASDAPSSGSKIRWRTWAPTCAPERLEVSTLGRPPDRRRV